MLNQQDTICAVSTPPGKGGISVIRISGTKAEEIVRSVCLFLPKELESHRAYYGLFKLSSEVIDEVVCTFFGKNRSFTGEEVFEVSCHGNPLICQRILNILISLGARLAEKGEFTFRAFMNGRVDLVQAESVLSLIESQSKQALKQSLRQLEGGLSEKLTKIEDQIIWCLAHLEASIDFSSEGIDVVEQSILNDKLLQIIEDIRGLSRSYESGRIIKDGFKLVLIGQPNVGKSSILNLLLEQEKAIVSEIPGTTRDLVESEFFINGIKVSVVDTAGIRDSVDVIERIGIQKSLKAQSDADGILFIFDCSRKLSQNDLSILERILKSNSDSKIFLIGNKSDLSSVKIDDLKGQFLVDLEKANIENLHSLKSIIGDRLLFLSALDSQSQKLIQEMLEKEIISSEFQDDAVIIQQRHFENLLDAELCLLRGLDLVKNFASPELPSLDIKQALLRIQETLGKRFDDQIMDRVFKEFCIGK